MWLMYWSLLCNVRAIMSYAVRKSTLELDTFLSDEQLLPPPAGLYLLSMNLSMNCPLVHLTAVFFFFLSSGDFVYVYFVFADSEPSISKFENQPLDYDPSSTNNNPRQFNIFWCYCCQFGSASHFQQFQSCPCWRGSERKRRCCCGQNGGRTEFSTATKVWIFLVKIKVF